MPHSFVTQPLAPAARPADRRDFRSRLQRGTFALVLSLSVPVILLVLLIAGYLWTGKWVDRADEVIAQSYLVEKLMVDMETGLRGFRLTAEERFLEPHRAARPQIDRELSDLENLVADDAELKGTVAALIHDTVSWRAYADEMLLRPIEGKVAMADLQRGKIFMDQIRSRVGELIGGQERVRAQRKHALDLVATTLLGFLGVASLVGIPAVALWLRRHLRAADAIYQASLNATERRSEELHTTLRSIGDAVLATDAAGCVTFLNPEAERLTRWTDAEARGKSMTEVFPIFNEETGAAAQNPAERVLREGVVVGLANHTVLRARGGGETPIEDSAAPIFHPDGSIRGMILVFRDVTESHRRDRALQVAEWLSRTALEVAGAGAYSWEVATNRVTADANTGQLFAIDPAAREGGLPIEEYLKAILPEYLPMVETAIAHSMKTGEDCNTEYHVRTAGGIVRWVNVRGRVDFDEGGKPTRLVGFVQDMTEQREAEAGLRERERLSSLRAEVSARLVAKGELASSLQDVCQLTAAHLDAAFVRIWTLDEASATLHLRASAGLYTHLDGPHARVPVGQFKIGRIAETRQPLLTNDVAHDPNISDPAWAAREGMRAFAGYPLVAEGKLVGVLAVFSREPFSTAVLGDLAPLCQSVARSIERRATEVELLAAKDRAESALRAVAESVERFRLLTEAVSLQVWTALPDGALDWANHYVANFFGVTDLEREVLGTGWTRFVHPEDIQEAGARWGRSVATGERYEAEFRLRRADGEYRWFLVRAEAMRSESGTITHWFGANTEMHEMKIARQNAEVAGRAKDNFLAALSHELRTPLTPVLMTAASLRQDDRLPAEVREDLAMIERNITLEARLIDDLLDLTRIAKGKLQLREELCDAHSLIGLALEIVRDEAQAKPVALAVDLQATHSGIIGDPARLQQVFWNLLRNAIKFTPRGGHVSIHTRDIGDSRLRIEVTDNGVGIAPESLEAVFRPFEQAEREGDHRFGGLGLGLAIARAIVDLHGGKIRAQSEGDGKGATFVVELPGATDQATGITGPVPLRSGQPIPPDISAKHPSLRLLLVEDHEPTLAVLARLLRRAGHSVVVSGTVADAVAAARGLPFDAIISDLGLPDGTGIDAMGKVRALQPNLPGIALSGYGMEEDLQRSLDAGFFTHLIKPVDFDQLRRALREVPAGRSD